jgi:hypothetical protein
VHVTEITVSAGRVVSHPLESYANLRPQVTLKARLDEGEDPRAAVRTLQAQAEELVEDHKNALVANLIAIDRMRQREKQIAGLEQGIRRDQAELDRLRAKGADAPALAAAPDEGADERPMHPNDF